MTSLPVIAEEARKVLSVFADNYLRCGESLLATNIEAYLAHEQFGTDRVEAGLVSGERHGWFIRAGDHRITLTQAGFAAI